MKYFKAYLTQAHRFLHAQTQQVKDMDDDLPPLLKDHKRIGST